MTTNIYFVRHGEVYNPKKIVYARLPRFKLSQKGKKEIEQTALFLADKKINSIYSSPLLRARQTAKIIQNKLSISKIHTTGDIHEVRTSLKNKSRGVLKLDYYSPPIWQKTDESMNDVAARMMRFAERISKKHYGKSIVAVSHGDPITILKLAIKNFPLNISSIRKFRYLQHGEVLLLQLNENNKYKINSVFIPNI